MDRQETALARTRNIPDSDGGPRLPGKTRRGWIAAGDNSPGPPPAHLPPYRFLVISIIRAPSFCTSMMSWRAAAACTRVM